AAGASIPVDVAFRPTNSGQRAAVLSATVMGETGTADIMLQGKGIGPKITATPAALSLGNVPFGSMIAPGMVGVANSGGATVTVTSIAITGPDAPRFSLAGVPALPLSLGATVGFMLSVSYTPTGPGQAMATIVVTS